MRKTKTVDGKKRVLDTEKAEALGTHAYSYYGDPAGYEETLYKNKTGIYFLCGRGGVESPYAEGEDIVPLTEKEAKIWLEA